jgi:hypothetical protein
MDTESKEIIFIRDITVTGFIRQYWPGRPTQKLDGIIVDSLKIIGGGTTPDAIRQQVIDQGIWDMENDQFSVLRRR